MTASRFARAACLVASLATAACASSPAVTGVVADATQRTEVAADVPADTGDSPADTGDSPAEDAAESAADVPAEAPGEATTDLATDADACPGLVHQAAATVAGATVDRYAWQDSRCQPRSAALEPGDSYGGSASEFTYNLSGGTNRVVDPMPQAGGFGYVVSHLADPTLATGHGEDDSPLGSTLAAASTPIFVGRNHAIHQFTLDYPRWGTDPASGAATKYDMPVTIQWLFATGRDHPLWTVTYDLSAAPDGAVVADFRSPYGDMAFDGEPPATWGDVVGGVAWGDSYRFASTATPLDFASTWDWATPNTWAPYDALWTRHDDAEMGIAGTRVITKQDAGGYQGGTGRGFTSANAPPLACGDYPTATMPCDWAWAFQSVNYSFGSQVTDTTGDKRLAWGADWGSLGVSSVTTINGNQVVGWPKVSYSVYVVLGEHSKDPTRTVAAQALAVDGTVLTASVGTVATSGPAGAGRTDTVPYSPAGFNHVYGTWDVTASGNSASLAFVVPAGTSLAQPMLVVHGYDGSVPPTVLLDGSPIAAGDGFFASGRSDVAELWLTLNRTIAGTATLRIN
jgi:hypothetical protein